MIRGSIVRRHRAKILESVFLVRANLLTSCLALGELLKLSVLLPLPHVKKKKGGGY